MIIYEEELVVGSKVGFSKISWFMWLVAVTFFAFQFVLRLFPGLVMTDIMGKFHIDATSFGVLSAAYYLGYAGMQIPIGILLDRFSARTVVSFCAFTCTIGSLSFVYSDNWTLTLIGRFLIGAGSAAGLLGTVKTIRYAFPEKNFTGMMGLTFTFGLSGALYGGKPVSLLIQQLGWVSVSKLLAALSLVISIGLLLFFPREAAQTKQETQTSQEPSTHLIEDLKSIFSNRKIIWLAIAGALMVGPFESFADVWGVSYLVNVYGFNKPDASLVTSGIYMGMLIGGPVLPYIAEKFNIHYWVNAISGLLMAAIFGIVIFTEATFSRTSLLGLMVFVGILCSYQAVVFAMTCKLAPSRLAGLVTSVTNCINMCAGCLFHFAIGYVMDLNWTGATENGIKVYEPSSYITAISLIPMTLVLGFLGFIWLNKQNLLTASKAARTS